MPEQKRRSEFLFAELEDIRRRNEIYLDLFCVQNISRTRRRLQKTFVDCYLDYVDQDSDLEAGESDETYESIILKAQEDAQQIINLARQHADKIIEDAERRASSLAEPLQKIRATL